MLIHGFICTFVVKYHVVQKKYRTTLQLMKNLPLQAVLTWGRKNLKTISHLCNYKLLLFWLMFVSLNHFSNMGMCTCGKKHCFLYICISLILKQIYSRFKNSQHNIKGMLYVNIFACQVLNTIHTKVHLKLHAFMGSSQFCILLQQV